jgi:hypothetical protein
MRFRVTESDIQLSNGMVKEPGSRVNDFPFRFHFVFHLSVSRHLLITFVNPFLLAFLLKGTFEACTISPIGQAREQGKQGGRKATMCSLAARVAHIPRASKVRRGVVYR